MTFVYTIVFYDALMYIPPRLSSDDCFPTVDMGPLIHSSRLIPRCGVVGAQCSETLPLLSGKSRVFFMWLVSRSGVVRQHLQQVFMILDLPDASQTRISSLGAQWTDAQKLGGIPGVVRPCIRCAAF